MKIYTAVCACVLSLTLLMPGVSRATNYFVSTAGNDSNSGLSTGAAWRTFSKALATATAGDTVDFASGTYVEGARSANNSGTAGSRIVFRSTVPHGAIFSGTSGCNAHIAIFGDYITFDGFRDQVDPSNIACGTGHNSSDGDAYRCFSGQGEAAIGTIIRNALVEASTSRSVSIKCPGTNGLVERNVVYNGIEVAGGNGAVFRDNAILGSDGFGSGFVIGKFGSRNVQAYNNYVKCASTFGGCFVLGGFANDTSHFDTATDIECYNCIAYNNVVEIPTGVTSVDIGFQGCETCLLAFNTFKAFGTGTARFSLLNGGPSSNFKPHNVMLKNNTLVLTTSAACTSNFTNFTGTLTVDYNNFWACAGPPAQVHNVVGNPLINADWTLPTGSPLIDTGTPVTTWPAYGGGLLTLDLASSPQWPGAPVCAARPSGVGYDVGACEHGALDIIPPSTPTGLQVAQALLPLLGPLVSGVWYFRKAIRSVSMACVRLGSSFTASLPDYSARTYYGARVVTAKAIMAVLERTKK